MINFGVGLVLGGALGLCIAGLLSAQGDIEQSDEWLQEYRKLEKRVKDAIQYAVVVRDNAGYKQMAVGKTADTIIGILQGDKE